jgi:AraC-like DNA-binding protein
MIKKENLSDRVVQFVLNLSIDEFQNISVARIAKIFNVNRSYLSRKFKLDKDFTLCEFIIREKLARSANMLRENKDMTIRELSSKLGFNNTNYFISVFKRFFGTPPGKYRSFIKR